MVDWGPNSEFCQEKAVKSTSGCVSSCYTGLFFLALAPILMATAPISGTFDPDQALKTSQAAVGQPLEEFTFLDSNERPVRLADFKGKPLIISLIYTSCFQTCSIVTRSLAEVVGKAQDALGEDSFEIVTVGFDVQSDKPKAMGWFAGRQGVADKHWRFLSGDADTVGRLVKNIGFSYIRSPKGFDHLTQATVVDAKGVIYRQVYGETILPPLLVDPLKELILGTPRAEDSAMEDLVRRVRFFCTTYDPYKNAYSFDYSLFVGLFIGATIILGVAYWLFREVMRTLYGKINS